MRCFVKFLSIRLFIKIFVAAWLVISWTSADAAQRDTRTLVLDNGLQVLLMHDPDVDRSAAALSVGVGQLYDPWEKQGLAHYLEHMLFLGTKKYPKVSSFKEYLNSNSGASNAYTGADITNYFLQVSHHAFEGALDRFSGFFREPLFAKKYAEREVNAVNSEFDKNRLQDGWRSNHLMHQISEKGHPLRKFGIGNKETLAGDNREALLAFHKKYYAASNMRLTILSNLSLSEQEHLAEQYFSNIPDHAVKKPVIDPNYRKPLKGKYRFIKIKSIKDTRRLGLEFPTIRLNDHLDSKPASVVASVLGYEGKGSLLSKLKEEGLALGLSAGGGNSHPDLSSFDIGVSLTEKGEAEYQRVLELVFAYIEMLRKADFKEYTFKEIQAMAQINFDWKNPAEGMGYVAGRAALMQNYKLSEVETLPYLFKKYDPGAYRAVLETLKPENMLVSLMSQKVKTDKTEKYFGTEYTFEEVGGKSFQRLVNPPHVDGMTYPEKNDFIPYNLALIDDKPITVRDDDRAKVWFKFDDRFKQPKVFLRLLIETPLVYDTVDHLAQSKLYEVALQEGLNEITYPISLAGLSYGLGIEKRGMTLTVGGYSERTTDLLRLVAKNLKQIRIDEEKFQNLKEAIIRSMENRKLGQSYSRAAYFNRQIWIANQYTEDQLTAALKKVTLNGIKDYATKIYKRAFIRGVIHGNWNIEQAQKSLDIVLGELKSQPLPEAERYKEVVEVLNPGKKVRFSKQIADNNNSIYYTLQAGERTFKDQALGSMVASVVESDFYTQMRTNQQLGYIVWSFHNSVEERLFFKMIIQSAGYGPFELQKRVEAWMKKSGKLFNNLSDEEFEKHRKSIIVSLEKKGDSIAEMAGDMYYFAVDEKGDFDFKKKLVKAVKKLTKEEVVKAGLRILQDPQVARSIVLMRSRSNKDKIPQGVLSEATQLKNEG
jgi:insulysin